MKTIRIFNSSPGDVAEERAHYCVWLRHAMVKFLERVLW
jgi:hypothetical protein